MSVKIAVTTTQTVSQARAQELASHLHLPFVLNDTQHYSALLVVTEDHLELRLTGTKAPGPIYIDFLKGSLRHRHLYGGGRGQLLARAIGLKKKKLLRVCDVTAGLGRDAFVMTSLGAEVFMIERSPIVAALLKDGLERAKQAAWFQELSLKLIEADSKEYLKTLPESQLPDVIYMDPMYPDIKRSALGKKAMRILRDIVGGDEDSEQLLQTALSKAKTRVVVKRARLAPIIAGPTPDLVYKGSSSRFDVYLTHNPE